MLPFEDKPWAKPVATAMILFTLLGAAILALYLHETKGLDTGAIVAILLTILAVVPPNIVVLRHRRLADRRHDGMLPAHTPVH
jgi:hypothetical protein